MIAQVGENEPDIFRFSFIFSPKQRYRQLGCSALSTSQVEASALNREIGDPPGVRHTGTRPRCNGPDAGETKSRWWGWNENNL